MSETIQTIAFIVFIVTVSIMTLVGVLSIWEVLDKDVLGKSLSTSAIVSFAALIVFIASKAFGNKKNSVTIINNNQQ